MQPAYKRVDFTCRSARSHFESLYIDINSSKYINNIYIYIYIHNVCIFNIYVCFLHWGAAGSCVRASLLRQAEQQLVVFRAEQGCAVGCRVCRGLLQSVVPLEAKRELGTVQRKGGRTVCVPWVGRNRSAALLPERGF